MGLGCVVVGCERKRGFYTFPATKGLVQVLPGHPLADPKEQTKGQLLPSRADAMRAHHNRLWVMGEEGKGLSSRVCVGRSRIWGRGAAVGDGCRARGGPGLQSGRHAGIYPTFLSASVPTQAWTPHHTYLCHFKSPF